MAKLKVAITVDARLLKRVDHLVRIGRAANRSAAIEDALAAAVDRIDRVRLARESVKLLAADERRAIDESLGDDFDRWPAY
jgi:metal-responsive CopG/Arc/MetJ family transcriptional regulator